MAAAPTPYSPRALALLRQMIGPDATFRAGQREAIAALTENRGRLLVVQSTGWGKSAVYFIATKMLREQGTGPTLLISPLLSLMRNQIQMAERLGITAVTINSTNNQEWSEIEADDCKRRLRHRPDLAGASGQCPLPVINAAVIRQGHRHVRGRRGALHFGLGP